MAMRPLDELRRSLVACLCAVAVITSATVQAQQSGSIDVFNLEPQLMNAKHNLIGAGVGALLLVSVLQVTIAQSPSQTDLGSGPGAIRLLPD